MFNIIIAYIGLVLSAGYGQEKDQGACIAFDKTEYDYGSIMINEKKDVTIPVRNTGKKPLVIHKIVYSCGCAIADKWKDVSIPPGGTKELGIKLSSKGVLIGQFKKWVKIYSNDPQNKEALLWIICEIKGDYWIETRVVRIKNVRTGGVVKHSVPIKSFMDQPLVFNKLNAGAKYMSASLREAAPMDKVKGYALYALDIEVDGTKLPKGKNRLVARINFKPNSTCVSRDYIVVQLFIMNEDLIITPDVVVFDPCFQGESREATIHLKHAERKEFVVSNLQTMPRFIEAHLEKQEACEAYIKVIIPEKNFPMILRGELTIVINYKDIEPIRIPIRGLIKPKKDG